MFSWSADTVRFMADACRRTDFHEKLTALLLPYLKPTDHICDAGCGLGYLSLALSSHAAHIAEYRLIEIPRGELLPCMAVLRQELDARGITNVTPLCADVLAYTPPVPFDAMVFCFFGSMEEILAAALRQCRGTVLAVVRDDVCHRFSGAPRAPGRHSFDAACGVLDVHGIPYTAQRAALDFPQPFRTLEDARTFLTLYGGGAPAEDDLRAKLISTGDPDFPWQLPGVRRFGMIAFSTEEGEHI